MYSNTMKKIFLMLCLTIATVQAWATDKGTRVSANVGLLYERGMDATISVEHETRYHNVWEYFATGYLKWDDCPSCGHICPETFWHNYNTWGVGVAYKPLVVRTRNTNGRVRFGASVGSDTHKFLGTLHLGYEHDYVLRNGVILYWQVKEDVVIEGKDLFRTGVAVGVKLPLKY